MLDHFRLIPFLCGIAAASAIFIVYKPEKQIIRQYPHPSSASEKTFRDKNNTCYTYSVHEVNCDSNEGTLRDYPIQG